MAYEVSIDDFNQDQWEHHARDFLDYSIYQTWEYQQVRAQCDGQKISRIIIKDINNVAVVMCHIRIKYIKLLGLKIGYAQWGPLMLRKEIQPESTATALKMMRDVYLDSRVNILRITPHVNDKNETGACLSAMLKSNGFEQVTNVKPYSTFMVSLLPSEEELLASLHKDCRRMLRKAEKEAIDIRESTSKDDFEIVETLYTQARRRKDFMGVDSKIFAHTQSMLPERDKAKILIAYLDGKPVTGMVISHFGENAMPVLLASNEKGLKSGASYYVFWKSYLSAKRLGMQYYDLGGIDKSQNPKGYMYKKRMGGQEISHIGTFETCSNLRVKIIWRIVERIYNLTKK